MIKTMTIAQDVAQKLIQVAGGLMTVLYILFYFIFIFKTANLNGNYSSAT